MALSLCTVAFAVDEKPAVPTSGKCGDNVDWSLTDGVLTISGTGVVAPLVRQVWNENAIYHEGYTDEETGDWVDDYYEGAYEDESYFPWDDAIEAAVYAALGVEDDDAFYGVIMNDMGAYYRAMFTAVRKLVIGEGITEIHEDAFDGAFMPEIIILPSTLEKVSGLNAMLAKELVINNPNISFEVSEVAVLGLVGENPYASRDAALNALFGALPYMSEAGGMFPEIAAELQKTADSFAEQIAEINAIEGASEEDKAAAIASIQQSAQFYVEMYQKYYGMTADTLEGLVAEAIAKTNEVFGTSFTSVDEMFVVVDEETGETAPSPALEAAYAAYEEKVEAAEELLDTFGMYPLGSEPKTTDEVYNEETGENDEVVIELTPTPWLTVYAPAESTAKAAAAISQVKFVSLEDAKAAFNAKKTDAAAAADAKAADGDSDASKALITGAKAAIDAIAYDEALSPEENNAAADAATAAVLAKLDTDLAAQREADKPAEPTTEKPDDKPADNDKDKDGGYSNNAFMKFIKKIIEFFKGIFDKITGIFKK